MLVGGILGLEHPFGQGKLGVGYNRLGFSRLERNLEIAERVRVRMKEDLPIAAKCDIEAHSGQPPITIEPQSGTIGTDVDSAEVSSRAPKCVIVRAAEAESSEPHDLTGVVETALARALVLAAESKRWDVVM